jgi:hypothetical protein
VDEHNLDKKALKALDHAHQFGFRAKVITETLSVIENDETIFYQNIKKIENFSAPGVINSLSCLLPGTGLLRINKESYTQVKGLSWKKLGEGFLISSISLGAISIGSKVYSNIYYRRYKDDLFGVKALSNYKNANISQKVFLSSFIGYGILGVLDFTFTFCIGAKNKAVQTKLNNELDNGKRIILY